MPNYTNRCVEIQDVDFEYLKSTPDFHALKMTIRILFSKSSKSVPKGTFGYDFDLRYGLRRGILQLLTNQPAVFRQNEKLSGEEWDDSKEPAIKNICKLLLAGVSVAASAPNRLNKVAETTLRAFDALSENQSKSINGKPIKNSSLGREKASSLDNLPNEFRAYEWELNSSSDSFMENCKDSLGVIEVTPSAPYRLCFVVSFRVSGSSDITFTEENHGAGSLITSVFTTTQELFSTKAKVLKSLLWREISEHERTIAIPDSSIIILDMKEAQIPDEVLSDGKKIYLYPCVESSKGDGDISDSPPSVQPPPELPDHSHLYTVLANPDVFGTNDIITSNSLETSINGPTESSNQSPSTQIDSSNQFSSFVCEKLVKPVSNKSLFEGLEPATEHVDYNTIPQKTTISNPLGYTYTQETDVYEV